MPGTDLGRRTGPMVECAHCGLPAPAPADGETTPAFCCAGCETVYELLHAEGLTGYYRLPERRPRPVLSSGRRYEEFDHQTFERLYLHSEAAGQASVDLYLEGVHCAACVWLVERVPRILPGVVRVELELARSRAQVTWNPRETSLSAVARRLDQLGYRPHPYRGIDGDRLRRQADREALVQIGVAGALAANIMLVAVALYAGLFGGMEASIERYFRWVSLGLTTPAVLWPGRVFFRGAWSALRTRVLTMDVPIALGLAAGFGRGVWNTVGGTGPVYFDGVATLIFLLLIGRYLQQRAQRAAIDRTELLHAIAPMSARLVDTVTGEERDVPAESLVPGMVVSVRAGESFPADGMVLAGRSDVDTALLSGESRPAPVGVGVEVWAGALNLTAALRVAVRAAGEATRVGRLVREIEIQARKKAPVVQVADRMAGWFVAAVLLLALGTAAAWWRTDPTRAIDNAIALLIVSCPCALALATPLALTNAIGRAARGGTLIRGGASLEVLARGGGTVWLDKTGTLTEGETKLRVWDGPSHCKAWVLALEAEASHPVAAGFREAWPEVTPARAAAVEHVLGGGVLGRVEGHDVVVGSERFLRQHGVEGSFPSLGGDLTPVYVAADGAIVATAGFGDRVRSGIAALLQRLRTEGPHPWSLHLLSGDAAAVAESVGRQLGFDGDAIRGGASPEEKSAVIAESPDRPRVMVGDGVNDAGALAAADVGIAVRGGAEASLAVADVYLGRHGLADLPALLAGARRATRVIRRNIIFGVVYNVAGAALAMAGLLHPLVAAILMPMSSLTVIVHSWRARTFDAGPAT